MDTGSSHADHALLATLGERLLRRRLERNRTQAQLAHDAGVSKRTIERIERGESTQTSNLMRVLRALGLLDRLDLLVPPPIPSPMQQLRLRRRERRRASPRRASGAEDRGTPPPTGWQWGDEQAKGGDA